MRQETCPYCAYAPTHESARQSVNKHLKYFASKPAEKRGGHPFSDDPAFVRLARQRGFRSYAKDDEERITRRAATQRTYKYKRLQRDMDSIRIALARLRRSPPAAPRALSTTNPTFPELVYYYLPEREWMSKGLSGSQAMGERQHELLMGTRCSEEHITTAWDAWEGLQGHRHSERQRMNLILTTMQWGLQWQLYREIQKGLYGKSDENSAFLEKWTAKGLAEAKADPQWSDFEDLEEFSEDNTLDRGYREPLVVLFPQFTEDYLLDATLPRI